jgi:hypothetical protein
MSDEPRLVYCHCAYAQVIPNDVKQGVLQRLTESGVDFECVADLCEMSARRDPIIRELSQHPKARIAACFPRAVQGLFTAAGCPLPAMGVEIVNMRVLNEKDAFEGLIRGQGAGGRGQEQASSEQVTVGSANDEVSAAVNVVEGGAR